jgi:beta-lactamase superfamily II metal-dependent hydrolase
MLSKPEDPTGTENNLPTLDFYCWSAGDADCLLLKTPGGRWGVIDCGLTNPNPKLRNPEIIWTTINQVRDFLVGQGVKRLAFAQMSHPELDHAKGLHQLLQHFELEIFCALPET